MNLILNSDCRLRSFIMGRNVVVTGVGIVTSLGEDADVHVARLGSAEPPITAIEPVSGRIVHPICTIDFGLQIPKRSDQRQMDAWQRLGVYAAGRALDDAGLKQDTEGLTGLHILVAAGGGERDYAVDEGILSRIGKAPDPEAFLNERLMNDLRPTLFLSQLSNLMAGNIAIVHGVTGGSCTFMGEEQAGVDAIRIAQARIAAGQDDRILVGGAYLAERADLLLLSEIVGNLWSGEFAPVFERGDPGGIIFGSGSVFLVLEEEEYARARGVSAKARLHPVRATSNVRDGNYLADTIARLWADAGAGKHALVISGATGMREITAIEYDALKAQQGAGSIHATGDLVGHTVEAQFPLGIALGALALARGMADEAVVTSIGHRRGEGLARLTPIGQGSERA
jgi:3-oxoacyl-[acyl-carrier-protein] synthase II